MINILCPPLFAIKKRKTNHFGRIMKISGILLFGAAFSIFAENAHSQKAKITLSKQRVSISEVLNSIEEQTDYLFLYNKKNVDVNKNISVNSVNEPVSAVLYKIFENSGIAFELTGKHIILKKEETSVNQQQKGIAISGKVVDNKGEAIIGANVIVKGTTNGAMTDIDGQFMLKDVPPAGTLQISYIGFLMQEVNIAGNKQFNIVLQEDTQTLDEVVVIGYGAIRKADLAGSVSVLDSKSFKDQPIRQVSDALQGRVSGVQVQNSGIPGGSVKIRVRGAGSINRTNDPLYVVDGIVRESGLDGINPEDIQSMQILKDASSTAIYGSRGSNGVVLISTKSGNVNQRIISFDAQVGVSSAPKRYDLLNPYEYALAIREYKDPNAFTEQEMNAYKNGTAGIDWQDEIFRNAITQDYKIAISNGNKDAQYYLSANYMGQEGILENTNTKRYSVRANITSDLTKWLHLNADINASHNTTKESSFDAGKGNPIWVAANYSPTMTILNEKGNYNKDPFNCLGTNPRATLDYPSESMRDIVNGHIDLRFNILPGLTFTTTNGVDYYDQKSYYMSTRKASPDGTASNGMSNSDSYRMLLQSSNNITYSNKWGKNNLTATAVYEATQSESRGLGISGSNLPIESVGWWDANMPKSLTGSNSYSKWTLASGVARVLYNFNERYMVTGTFRADGSSKFSGDKWGYFPSAAIAWNLGNEAWMKNQKLFEDFKVRASFGLVGSQAISPYSTLGTMSTTSYAFGSGSLYNGYWNYNVPTPNVSWEKTRQLDLGIDFSMFNHRLNVSFDYFDKKTIDGLLTKTIPAYNGGGTYWVNNGKVSNKGVDFSLTGRIFQEKDFSWNSTITGTYLKNEVLSLDGENFIITGSAPSLFDSDICRIEVGRSIGSFYGYVWEGLDSEGKNKYKDVDGDGKITSTDKEYLGKSLPTFTLGWNNQLTWKNWELNLFFNGAFGTKKMNMIEFSMANMYGDTQFITLKDAYYKSFDKLGANAPYASLKAEGNTNYPGSSRWLESADYIRLENISLSYNLSRNITKFADLRFTVSAQNLFTISGYNGLDPAGMAFSSSNVDVYNGFDFGAYPTPRTVTFGLRMNF